MTASLLIIDDEQTIRKTLRFFFEKKGYEVFEAADGAAGLEATRVSEPEVILLDIKLPDMNGLDVLTSIKESGSSAVVLIMTAHGDTSMATEAMRQRGAFWFFSKPIDMVMLELQVDQAREHALALNKGRLAEQRVAELQPTAMSLGESKAIAEVSRLIEVVAESRDTTVLLLGESGTGKGVVAEAIHRQSERADQPFQQINCAGLSDSFLETELFGAERGAYTDSKSLKRGLMEVADGGTIFLDEVGDLAPGLQPKLLTVLESKRFRRLGGVKDIEVDVRIVAATNRDLEAAMKAGSMRQDLYYRLNVMQVRMPPLRERGQDVLLLANRFLLHFAKTLGKPDSSLTEEAEKLLLAHSWPGNVRELKNVVERAMILSRGGAIAAEHLPSEFAGATSRGVGSLDADNLPSLEDVEKDYIGRVLELKDGNRSQSAVALGISRSTLIEKIKRYGL